MMIAAWSLETWELSGRGLQIAFVIFLVFWTAALGAALGSFLNVIIYRMPRGMSLVRPKSRCPACAASIRATDNVPILGWLRLRGRCRTCGAPISVRYPLVEGLIAILLLALVWCEVYAGGINLPGDHANHLASNPLLWRWDPVAIIRCAYHAFLLMVAVAVGWMAWDGFPPPRWLVALTLLLGIAVPMFVPGVWPLASGIPRWLPEIAIGSDHALTVDFNALSPGGIGLAAGFSAGTLLAIATSVRFDVAGVLFLASMTGLYLGWPALVTYAPIAGGMALAGAVVARWIGRMVPVTATCAAALVVQVFAWRSLARSIDSIANEIGWNPSIVVPLAAILAVCLFAGLARKIISAIFPSITRDETS